MPRKVHSHSATLPATQPKAAEPRLPSLDEEIAHLVTQRDRVQAWLRRRIAEGKCADADAIRYLTALSQVTGRLAALLLQRAATTGAQELEQFFEEVSRRAEELAAAGFQPYDSACPRPADPAGPQPQFGSRPPARRRRPTTPS